jgi:NAD+ kinase
MTIAIFGKSFDPLHSKEISQLINGLIAHNHELIVFNEFADYLKSTFDFETSTTFSNHRELQNVKLMISIGGDGTILNTLTYIRHFEIPVLGINTGRLGFLSTVNTDEIADIIEAIDSGNYECEERSVLELSSPNNLFAPVNYALNEMAIHKNDRSSMITISAYLNDVYLNSYWADGIIVSTATGSTAYSMSCGGPIVLPGSQVLVITPIAPHNLNVRPIVVPDKLTIRLEVEGREEQHLVSLDSRAVSLDSALPLEVKKAPFKMKLVRLHDRSFVETIRTKLNWGLDKRN